MSLFELEKEVCNINGIDFNRISLSDKSLFEDCLDRLFHESVVWENCFSVIFCHDKVKGAPSIIWKEVHGYLWVFSYTEKSNRLHVYCNPIPVKNKKCDLKKSFVDVSKILGSVNGTKPSFMYYCLKRDDVLFASKKDVVNEDYQDFVFKSDDLINLSGSAYRGRRSMVNRFVRDNPSAKIRPYKTSDKEAVLDLKKSWVKLHCERTGNTEKDMWDGDILNYYLKYLSELRLEVYVVEIEGVVQAFSVYDKLCSDCMIAISRCSNTEISGLSEFLWYRSVQMARSFGEYQNDGNAGKEDSGLFFYKQSHNPHYLVNKAYFRLNKSKCTVNVDNLFD